MKNLLYYFVPCAALCLTLPTARAADGEAETAPTRLRWQNLPPIPNKLGVGGPFVGVHRDALIVAGGANFPNDPPWDNGAKVWHDDVYILESPEGPWLRAAALPRRLAYGVSISTADGLLLVGGEEDGAAVASVYRLSWDSETKEVAFAELPALPKPASYIAGGMIDGTVYVAACTRSDGANRLDEKHFWSLNLDEANDGASWESLPVWPGSPRHKAVAATQRIGTGQLQFFLLSGSNPRWLPDGSPELSQFERFTDAYRYDPTEQKWTALSDLPVVPDDREIDGKEKFAAEPRPVVAGCAVSMGQSHVFVFSGSTAQYLTLPLQDRPPFPQDVLAYHTITDRWVQVGKMPQGVVTTSATQWRDRVVIPTGEVRPGVRTPTVQTATIVKKDPEFGAVNYAVLTVYLLAMVAVGGFFALRTKSTNDFFRGGQRVPFWVAGLSIFATMLSSITFMALPAKAYATDWLYYPAQLTIIPVAVFVVLVAIPFFRQIDATTAYEYLEKRFSRPVRLLGSAQFVLFQIGRMAIVMYLPALALAAITPLTVGQCILVMGVLSVVYCTLGGVEAVVWTDAIQTIVLMGGLIVALAVILLNVEGGVSILYTTAWEDGKLRLADMDFSPASYTGAAIWVVLLGTFFQSLYSYTSDQAVVQRYLTTEDVRGANRAMWTTAWMSVFGSLLFFVLGAALYVFYKTHPTELDPTMKTDAVFPLFIATRLPVGVAGLVVAGIFAAAQSTVSTSMNSTATAIVTDFCVPFNLMRSDAAYLRLARFLTALLGALGTAVALYFAEAGVSSMMDEFIKVLGLFGGALCGLFMLGMLTRRANAIGGLAGAAAGIASVWYVSRATDASFFLYAMVGTIVTFIAGYCASFATPPPNRDIDSLTIYGRDANRQTAQSNSAPTFSGVQ